MSGLYIHVPFCASKCSYCDFYSMPAKDEETYARYARAVVKEFRMRAAELPDKITTIYIGGGTPSQLKLPILREIIDGIRHYLAPFADTIKEFTIEVNPEDVTPRLALSLCDAGINRVSMGVQSLVDSELTEVGRRHSAAKALEAIEVLKSTGLNNISADLIYGLPGQTIDSWKFSLDTLLSCSLPHLSAYALSYEPGTRLSARRQAGKITPVDEDTSVAMYDYLITTMREHGYDHYEISNFSLPDCRAVHNSGYWNMTPYLGLGPGAHSFDGTTRRVNAPNLKNYLAAIEADTSFFTVEEETATDRTNDYIITELRKKEGLSLSDMARRFSAKTSSIVQKAAAPFLRNGQLILDGDRIKFTESSWLVSDMVLRELII